MSVLLKNLKTSYFGEFETIFFSFVFVTLIIISIPLLSTFLISTSETNEKISSYECGFQPFGSGRSKFEVKFFLVAILFVLFDLEILFLFPQLILQNSFNHIVFSFLFILTVGFIYEQKKKALDQN